MLRAAFRYFTNLVSRVAEQQGIPAALREGIRFGIKELVKIPRIARLALSGSDGRDQADGELITYSQTLIEALASLDVPLLPYRVDGAAFREHVAAGGYPRNYAAGPMSQGGAREQKLLEYFVSLDLLHILPTDVVIDVASEWSLFPDVVRKLVGAQVYRQDLIYPPGIQGDRIGGSAASMPIPEAFADVLVLHNAFEHFEGTADTDFIGEAWRVLKPGGRVCILPLFVAERHSILTDPLVDRRGVVWDEDSLIVERPWFHNRFGRFYSVKTLQERVLEPGSRFDTTIYHVVNIQDIHPLAYLYFALVMQKPAHAHPQTAEE